MREQKRELISGYESCGVLVGGEAYAHLAPLSFAPDIERMAVTEAVAFGPGGKLLTICGIKVVPMLPGGVFEVNASFRLMVIRRPIVSVRRPIRKGMGVELPLEAYRLVTAGYTQHCGSRRDTSTLWKAIGLRRREVWRPSEELKRHNSAELEAQVAEEAGLFSCPLDPLTEERRQRSVAQLPHAPWSVLRGCSTRAAR